MSNKDMKIEDIHVPDHPWKFNKDVFDLLKESIKEFGLINPIQIDENNILLNGYSRLKACKELGYLTIKVFVLSNEEYLNQEYKVTIKEAK